MEKGREPLLRQENDETSGVFQASDSNAGPDFAIVDAMNPERAPSPSKTGGIVPLKTIMTTPLLLLACTDYGFNTGQKQPGSALSDTSEARDTSVEIAPPETPPEWVEDCDDGIEAEILPKEMAVLAWDPVQSKGTLNAPGSGWFHIYDYVLAESGASQRNETVYLRIPNADQPTGEPRFKNCDSEWIVLDPDNNGSPNATARQYMGTFWLVQGLNEILLNHYCPLYRNGQCGSFHNTDMESTTCDAGDANSAHMTGRGVCMKPL